MSGEGPSEQSLRQTGIWTTVKQQTACSHTGRSCLQSGSTLTQLSSPTMLMAQRSAGTHPCLRMSRSAWTLAGRDTTATEQQCCHQPHMGCTAAAAAACDGSVRQQRGQQQQAAGSSNGLQLAQRAALQEQPAAAAHFS